MILNTAGSPNPAKSNLYRVQDSDRPMFVIAQNFQEAIEKWADVIRHENNLPTTEEVLPEGVNRLCDHHDLIV